MENLEYSGNLYVAEQNVPSPFLMRAYVCISSLLFISILYSEKKSDIFGNTDV